MPESCSSGDALKWAMTHLCSCLPVVEHSHCWLLPTDFVMASTATGAFGTPGLVAGAAACKLELGRLDAGSEVVKDARRSLKVHR